MATGPEAVAIIAEATGIPAVTVDRVARFLKQHSPPLWPRSPQGGGAKAEHATAAHLVNLAIGLAVGEPFPRAPIAVALYGGMYSVDVDLIKQTSCESFHSQRAMSIPWGGGEKLNDYLCRLINEHSNGNAAEEEIWGKDWKLTLHIGPRPQAQLSQISLIEDLWSIIFRPPQDEISEFATSKAAPAEFERAVTLNAALIRLFADLVRDARNRKSPKRTTPAPAKVLLGADSETGNAASPDREAAPTKDQDRDDPRASNTRKGSARDTLSQAPRRGSGPSPLAEGADTHDRRRYRSNPAAARAA